MGERAGLQISYHAAYHKHEAREARERQRTKRQRERKTEKKGEEWHMGQANKQAASFKGKNEAEVKE